MSLIYLIQSTLNKHKIIKHLIVIIHLFNINFFPLSKHFNMIKHFIIILCLFDMNIIVTLYIIVIKRLEQGDEENIR